MRPSDSTIANRYIHPSHVRERDIDLLLLEEFHSDANFSQFFLTQIGHGIPNSMQFLDAQVSVRNSIGQSDLQLNFENDGRRVRVLIENKIDALFQQDQAARYSKRGSLSQNSGECSEFCTVLIAPAKYLQAGTLGFDACVSYEAIKLYFEQSTALSSARMRCKIGLMQAAIDKGAAVDAKDKRITAFWRSYWELTQAIAPELCMPEPTGRSGGFVHFYPHDLPNEMEFIHKMSHGRLDLQIPRMGSQVAKIRNALGEVLPVGMKIVRAHGAAAIRKPVSPLVMETEFIVQKDEVISAIRAAKEVGMWVTKNRILLMKLSQHTESM